MRIRVRVWLPVLFLAAGGLALWHERPRLSALAFILRAAQQSGALSRWARATAMAVERQPIRAVATRHGDVATQLYRPAQPARRTTLLVPGLHMDGIAEDRLVSLAGDLAASGMQVLTVAPPDLARYRVTADSVDELEDVAAWAAAQPALAPDGKVGIAAVSFSGALALVTAGRSAVRDRVAFALSLGGYADLARVLRYLCDDDGALLPPGTDVRTLITGGQHIRVPRPNEYGAVVTLLNLVDRLVPAEQSPALADAVTAFLRASSLDRVAPDRARALFAEARQRGEAMPEPSRSLMKDVSERNVDKLGRALRPLLARLELPAALSPDRSPAPRAPVFLLHGADDSVVPASELVWLVLDLRSKTYVRGFASRLISHAAINRGALLSEMWRLAAFWADLMGR